jgi:MFS family permease
MGLLTLVEDRPTPASVYNWRVYTCAMVASFASCMIGYDSAFIGTTLALPSFVKEFGFKALDAHHLANIKANIVSVYQAGAFFGSLLAYGSAFFLGRRQSLWVFSVVFMIGAGVMLIAKNGDLAPILAGRVLAGIGVGGASMIVPIYISEISPPAIRGRLVGIYEMGWQLGGLVGFWINVSATMALMKPFDFGKQKTDFPISTPSSRPCHLVADSGRSPLLFSLQVHPFVRFQYNH